MIQDQTLLKLLEESGLTGKEARVYLALLEIGQGSVGDISLLTDLKRPIIYVILEGLIKRGYASALPDKKVNNYQASDPSLILKRLQTVTKNFSEMIPIMRTLHNKGGGKPKITYHDTKEGIKKIYDEVNNCEEAFFITNYAKIESLFPGILEIWENNYKQGLYKLKSRNIISNNKDEIAIARKFMEAADILQFKVLPGLDNNHLDFSVYGDKLAITSFGDKPFIVAIESEGLNASIMPIFNSAWKASRSIYE